MTNSISFGITLCLVVMLSEYVSAYPARPENWMALISRKCPASVSLLLSCYHCVEQAATCRDAGLNPGCCTGQCRTAGGCYCDRVCFIFNDCCNDVQQGTQCNILKG